MVRAVESFMGWRCDRASRTSSALLSERFHNTSITKCSNSESGLRGVFARNILPLQSVAVAPLPVKNPAGKSACRESVLERKTHENIRLANCFHPAGFFNPGRESAATGRVHTGYG